MSNIKLTMVLKTLDIFVNQNSNGCINVFSTLLGTSLAIRQSTQDNTYCVILEFNPFCARVYSPQIYLIYWETTIDHCNIRNNKTK